MSGCRCGNQKPGVIRSPSHKNGMAWIKVGWPIGNG